MKAQQLLLIATLAIPSLAVASTALANEKEKVVKLDDIPAPARDRIVKEAKGDRIVRVEVEQSKGKTLYEGVVSRGSDEIGIVVDAKGNLVGTHSEKNEKHEKNEKNEKHAK